MTKEKLLKRLKDIKSEIDTVNCDDGVLVLLEKSQHSLENAENMINKLIKEYQSEDLNERKESAEKSAVNFKVKIRKGNGEIFETLASGDANTPSVAIIDYFLHYYKKKTGDKTATVVSYKPLNKEESYKTKGKNK